MEDYSLNFANLEKAIGSFVDEFIKVYRGLLIRDGKKATGNLISSLKPVSVDFEGKGYVGSISLASYWKYVEYGRRPGKFPPPDKILEWVKVKPVLPRPINGIKPTEKQLAFLISRKIARDGIEAGNQFSEALDIAWSRKSIEISQAIEKDLQEKINLIRI